MPTRRDDPYARFNFLVQIDGVDAAGFAAVEGLTAAVEPVEYREGADRENTVRLLPGLARHGRVTLRRGFAGDGALFQWWKAVAGGAADRRGVAIVLLDERHEPVARWTLRRAWPTRYEGPSLDATANEVAVEALELAHEGLELDEG